MVNCTPRPLYPLERPGTYCTEASWIPGPVWTGAENLTSTGIRFPDRPARSQSLYRLSCTGPPSCYDAYWITEKSSFNLYKQRILLAARKATGVSFLGGMEAFYPLQLHPDRLWGQSGFPSSGWYLELFRREEERTGCASSSPGLRMGGVYLLSSPRLHTALLQKTFLPFAGERLDALILCLLFTGNIQGSNLICEVCS